MFSLLTTYVKRLISVVAGGWQGLGGGGWGGISSSMETADVLRLKPADDDVNDVALLLRCTAATDDGGDTLDFFVGALVFLLHGTTTVLVVGDVILPGGDVTGGGTTADSLARRDNWNCKPDVDETEWGEAESVGEPDENMRPRDGGTMSTWQPLPSGDDIKFFFFSGDRLDASLTYSVTVGDLVGQPNSEKFAYTSLDVSCPLSGSAAVSWCFTVGVRMTGFLSAFVVLWARPTSVASWPPAAFTADNFFISSNFAANSDLSSVRVITHKHCVSKNRTSETFYYNFAKIDLISIKIGTHNLHMM